MYTRSGIIKILLYSNRKLYQIKRLILGLFYLYTINYFRIFARPVCFVCLLVFVISFTAWRVDKIDNNSIIFF